jgi:hypothetical protein
MASDPLPSDFQGSKRYGVFFTAGGLNGKLLGEEKSLRRAFERLRQRRIHRATMTVAMHVMLQVLFSQL